MKESSNIIVMLSLTAAMLLSTGCGGGSDSGEISTNDAAAAPMTISGKAVDGYLRYATVCLDLDGNGYCQIGYEPAASTRVDGTYELTVTTEQQNHPNFSTANLVVFGGQDSDTNKDFNGKLISAFDMNNPTNVFITPLSTMAAAIKDTNVTLNKDAAEQKVAELLGLTAAQINADPVAEAKNGDTKALSKALELQKAVEVLAAASDLHDIVATEKVYQALAEGVKSVDVSTLDGGVASLLQHVDTSAMDAEAVALLAAAAIMAQNVETAVSGMTGVDDTTILAVVNSIDNVKSTIEAEVDAFDFTTGAAFTTEVNATSVTDPAYQVTTDSVALTLLRNIIETGLGQVLTLTDVQLQPVLDASNGATIESLTDVSVFIAADSAPELLALKEQIDVQIAKDAAQAQLEAAYDGSVTAQDVLTTKGLFDVWYDDYNAMAYVNMVKVVDNLFQYYDYNATSGQFDLFSMFGTLDTSMEQTTITLQDGAWVSDTQTVSMMPEVSFDAFGNLIFSDIYGGGVKYSVTGYDASGLKITDIYKPWTGVEYNGTKTFSEGSKYYEVYSMALDAGEFVPTYALWFYENWSYDPVTDTAVLLPGNINYEFYISSAGDEVPYTSISEFISGNYYTGQHSSLFFWNESTGEELYGYFADNGVLEFYPFDYMTGTFGAKSTLTGVYALQTIGTVEILVIKPPVELEGSWLTNRAYTMFSVQDGQVRRGGEAYAAAQLSEDFATSVFVNYNETAAMDIYAALNEGTTVMAAPARLTTLTVDPVALEIKKRAERAKEASLKAYRGF